MPSWNKVWVLEGDPFFVHFKIKDIQQELGMPEISTYNNNSSADTIKSALTAFSFFELPNLVVISEPNADILKMCFDLAESNFNASGLVLTCEHNTFDSRLSFISKAAKNKRNFYFSPLQDDEIIDHVKEWSKEYNIKISSDCFNWFKNNAPTITSKMKTQSGKKDIIVYDLMSLEAFLQKIYVIYKCDENEITVKDLSSYSNFNRESDVWIFIENVISGKLDFIYNYFYKNPISLSNHSVLWLLLSQFEFLIQVRHYLNKGQSQNTILENLTMKNILGYYLNDNMEEVQNVKPKAAINPYRLQMAIKTCSNTTIDDLVNKYHATISGIRDLRSGLDAGLVSHKLCFAYSNKNLYLEPFLDV